MQQERRRRLPELPLQWHGQAVGRRRRRDPPEVVPALPGGRQADFHVLRHRPAEDARQEHRVGRQLPEEVSVVHEQSGQTSLRVYLFREPVEFYGRG